LQPVVQELSHYLDRNDSSFGGLYIDYNPYTVTVLAQPGSSSELAQSISAADLPDLNPYVVEREVPFTEQSLADTTMKLDALKYRFYVTDLSTDGRAGIVTISGATQKDAEGLQDYVDSSKWEIDSSNIKVDVEPPVKGPSTNDFQDSYGGLKANVPGPDYCTSGFSITRDGSTQHGITDAAHCANTDVEILGEPLTFEDQSWGGNQDVQWFSTPTLNDVNKVVDGSGTRHITDTTSRANMNLGQTVCHYGATSGYDCGIISNADYDPGLQNTCADFHADYEPTFIKMDRTPSQGGDSGGPFYNNNTAFGIDKCHDVNDGKAVFMPQNFMHGMNITVRTS
jgi:hypothetical protein